MTTAHDQIVQVFAQLEKMPPDQVTTVILTLENRAVHVPPVPNMGASREPWLEGCRDAMQPVFAALDTFANTHGLTRAASGGVMPYATFKAPNKALLALRDAPHLRGITIDAPVRLLK